MEKISHEEVVLERAALSFATKRGIPVVKAAWAVALLTGKPDSAILKRLEDYAKNGPMPDELPDSSDDLLNENKRYEDIVSLESRVGEVVRARVLSLKTFGAVCSVLGTTRTLLLHISEVADTFVSDITDYAFEGMEFDAMIVVNRKDELGLSTRRVKPLEKVNAEVHYG